MDPGQRGPGKIKPEIIMYFCADTKPLFAKCAVRCVVRSRDLSQCMERRSELLREAIIKGSAIGKIGVLRAELRQHLVCPFGAPVNQLLSDNDAYAKGVGYIRKCKISCPVADLDLA